MKRWPVGTVNAFQVEENEGGVKLRAVALVEIEAPTTLGAGHRQHLLELVLAEATRLGLRWGLK